MHFIQSQKYEYEQAAVRMRARGSWLSDVVRTGVGSGSYHDLSSAMPQRASAPCAQHERAMIILHVEQSARFSLRTIFS